MNHSTWTHHRTVGIGYLLISAAALIIGTLLSLLMRLHLAWPAWHLPLHGAILPEEYLALVTMHGTLMLFFVMTVAPLSGFANLILPAQIGAAGMAFPRLNLLSLALTTLALFVLLCAFFVHGGSPIGGWSAYPPLSSTSLAGPGEGAGMDLWLASIALFILGGTVSALVTLTTAIRMRCEGMTWSRVPLTVWAWVTASLLSLLAFTVLLAAVVLLTSDRHLHTGFFLPAQELVNGVLLRHSGDGSPLLWLHLFWFFGHPEVYLAILPGMGLTSVVLSTFARRSVPAPRLMITTTLLLGLLGIVVWGHHMFVAGLSPFAGSAFSLTTIAIALPASAKVLSWLATVWRSRPRMEAPMYYALAFVSFFVAGGVTGPILAQPALDEYLHNTFFVVAHFHLIMAMAGVFGIFCALQYWFPLIAHRRLSEPLAKWHCVLTAAFAYSTFLPMHLTGLSGEPRHYSELVGPSPAANALLATTVPWQHHISASAILLIVTQLLFIWNICSALCQAPSQHCNPWGATTLEWAPRPPEGESFIAYCAPCLYSDDGANAFEQWNPACSAQSAEE